MCACSGGWGCGSSVGSLVGGNCNAYDREKLAMAKQASIVKRLDTCVDKGNKPAPAEVYLQVACAVIADIGQLGKGDHQGDERRARQIRKAAKAIYKEVSEEMDVLSGLAAKAN